VAPPTGTSGPTSVAVVITRISFQRIVLWAPVLMLALVAGVSPAGARSNARAASLKVSMPASIAMGSVLTVTARGYSGKYDAVSWSSMYEGGSACSAPGINAITTQAVSRGHAFNLRLTNVFGPSGSLTVCVYLFTSGANANDTKGHYIARGTRVKVS
jgi:hypothetical protein